ncbi:hypothetical protein N7468_008589 [Penicillium chermesinum]|uniref:Uncharacterized protein n=1 Tax=Penicillium chermesinum TaxID=63820 RepID=A0A9W9NQ30_9EURO|nr:uncharacterized protein N7468_008589 [Penicillium chermesinum]KAJ5224047.1 hypothetical protein N7468_008589 [Penicillium chermesinum]KAJ6155137.1 hypothetical protein N7470_005703 [Penicillium chermesinum]
MRVLGVRTLRLLTTNLTEPVPYLLRSEDNLSLAATGRLNGLKPPTTTHQVGPGLNQDQGGSTRLSLNETWKIRDEAAKLAHLN